MGAILQNILDAIVKHIRYRPTYNKSVARAILENQSLFMTPPPFQKSMLESLQDAYHQPEGLYSNKTQGSAASSQISSARSLGKLSIDKIPRREEIESVDDALDNYLDDNVSRDKLSETDNLQKSDLNKAYNIND